MIVKNNAFITKDAKYLLNTFGIKSVFLDQKIFAHLLFLTDDTKPVPMLTDHYLETKVQERGVFLLGPGKQLENLTVKNKVLDAQDVLFNSVAEPSSARVIAIVIANKLGTPLMVIQPFHLLIGIFEVNGGDIWCTWSNDSNKIAELTEFPMYKEEAEKRTFWKMIFPWLIKS